MATFTLRRFANPGALKAIKPEHLLELLERYGAYFEARGIQLRPLGQQQRLDYEGITRVLIAPDDSTPRGLIDDLFYVHEMATNEAMDALLEEVDLMTPEERSRLDLDSGMTPADVAVQIRLRAPEILEHKHAETFFVAKRSFEYFQAARGTDRKFRKPDADAIRALEHALDDRLEAMKRGRNTRVFVCEKEDGIWFLVRRGDPYKRESTIEDGDSSCVYYRPERYDALKYDAALGELSLNVENKKIGALYRQQFGLHFFGNMQQFPGTAKYTLDPLREDGAAALVCSDVSGIKWIRMKEIQLFWGGPEAELEIRRASDIFAVFERQHRSIPETARLVGASFLVRFSDSRTPRTVTIRPNNLASYTRDSDAAAVEEWLMKRGFISETNDDDARATAAVANA